MKAEIIPHTSKINASTIHLDLLARLTAPMGKKKAKRPSLNLAVALDQSGSMASNGAFEQAKIATLGLLDRLDPTDRIAVVLYSSAARVVLASCPVSEARTRLPQLLACEHASGSTALHQGWLVAAQQAAPFVKEYSVSRVLLLSDGQATDGKRDPFALKEEAHQLLHAGISTGTYGLGLHFNEVLMTEMAAGGPARFAQDADELLPYFQSDFAMLSQVAATRVELKVDAVSSSGKVLDIDMINGYTKQPNGFWSLPAAICGAETWGALRVPLEKGESVQLTATWRWKDMEGQDTEHTQHIEVGTGKGRTNNMVVERINEALASQMAKQAAEAARLGDVNKARGMVGMMRSLSASNAYINTVSDNLDGLLNNGDMGLLAKEALYSSSAMSTRVAETGEDSAKLSNDRFGLRKAVQGRSEEKQEGAK